MYSIPHCGPHIWFDVCLSFMLHKLHILSPHFSCSLIYHRVPAPPHTCCLPGQVNSLALCYLSQSHPFYSKVHSSHNSSTITMVAHCFVEFLILSPQWKCQSSLTLHL